MEDLASFAGRVHAHFERIHRDVFLDDPAANPNLSVEILGQRIAHDTQALTLIAPWTLCGIARPPDQQFPPSLRIGKKPFPTISIEVDGIGEYWSVILIPDVSGFSSQADVRAAALPLSGEFNAAVEKWRANLGEVKEPGRRALFKTMSSKSEAATHEDTAFGTPGRLPA